MKKLAQITIDDKRITEYLKTYFKDKKISQYEIADKTGITRYKITQSFNNKRKLTAKELLLIAYVYEIDLNKLKEISFGKNQSHSK